MWHLAVVIRKDLAFIFVSSLLVDFFLFSSFSLLLLYLLSLFLVYILYSFFSMLPNTLLSFVFVYFFLPIDFPVILNFLPCLHSFRLFSCFLFYSSLIPHVVSLFLKFLFLRRFFPFCRSSSFLHSFFPLYYYLIFPCPFTLLFPCLSLIFLSLLPLTP
jgi:hypothetical protein